MLIRGDHAVFQHYRRRKIGSGPLNVQPLSTVLREGGVSALKADAVTLRLGAWLGVALAVASATFVGGYALTTVANTIFLHNLAPVMVFPLAWWLFKERELAGAAAAAGWAEERGPAAAAA